MTIVTLSQPLNLNATTLWEGELVGLPTSTEIVVSDGVRTGTFTGNFSFNFFTQEVFGTLDSFVTTNDSVAEYSFTDMGIDVNALFTAIETSDIDLAFSLFLGGDDTLNGSSGRDILFSDAGNDRLLGNGGNDLLKGEAGHDKMFGGNGKDKMLGGSGKDLLNGGDGKDILIGGAGRDRLIGGKGDDTITGGSGVDKFIFNNKKGDDWVSDFNVGTDILVLSTKKEISVTEIHDGDSVLLEWGGNSVILLDVTLDDYNLI